MKLYKIKKSNIDRKGRGLYAIKDIKVGDHVVFQFSPSCGRCRRCLEGRPQVCELAAATKGKGELMSGGSRLKSKDGETLNHHTGISCMSEFAVVDRGSVVVIDKSIPPISSGI